MKLYEFFSLPQSEQEEIHPRDLQDNRKEVDKEKLADELYFYILDHDKIHKEEFIPLAMEIGSKLKSKNLDRKAYTKKFLPMVNRACMEYYKENEMTEDPKDVFTKEMRKGLCQKLADQSFEDIEKGEYNLG